MPQMQLLPAAARHATPWKNGGGLTYEVSIHPPGSDLSQFDWRVSTAEVCVPGSFSCYAGIDRRLAVLEGRLLLSIADQPSLALTPQSDPLVFGGETSVYAAPEGKVIDLNVMTRRGAFEARLERHHSSAGLPFATQAPTTLLFALSELRWVGEGGDHCLLSRRDALRLEGLVSGRLELRAQSLEFYLIQIDTCRGSTG